MTCYYINFPQKFLLLEEQVTEDKTTCIDNKNAISEDSHVGNGSTEYSHVVNCKNTESHDPEGKMRIGTFRSIFISANLSVRIHFPAKCKYC